MSIYLFVISVCGSQHVTVHVRRSEDDLQESVLFFYQVGPGLNSSQQTWLQVLCLLAPTHFYTVRSVFFLSMFTTHPGVAGKEQEKILEDDPYFSCRVDSRC